MCRLVVLLAGAVLVAGCGSGTRSYTPSPVELWVVLDMNKASFDVGNHFAATVCADDNCKTFTPASCEADHGRACFIGIGLTVIFKYPHYADLPDNLSVRVVSDSGQTLYSRSGPRRCTLRRNICESTFRVP